MALIHKEMGRGQIGWQLQRDVQGSFATLEIYDDKIIFGLPSCKYNAPISDIKSVELIYTILPNGVVLRFHNPGLPFFVFWSSARKITTILQGLCTNLEPKRPWYKNPVQVLNLVVILFILVVLSIVVRIILL
jgi:hypothetical protein